MTGAQRGVRLESAAAATGYQREWFHELGRRTRGGDPWVLANADAPHELFRAFGLPYVVNQWWASIASAKQAGPAALAALRAQGLPDFSRQYDALPLGAQDLPVDNAPWGGLPDPLLAVTERGGDVSHKIFDRWGERTTTETVLLSRTAADPVPDRWWELVPDRWEEAFGGERIDFLHAELIELAALLADRTGRELDPVAFDAIMRRANEQAEWNARTRDLIASARPTPVAVGDTIPSVMIPQWHRGSEWAVAAAERLYDDVSARVREGSAVCTGERVRLMWIGRGLWSDLSLYRAFEEEFGAVFVWSMYLALAADGYVRRGPDPMRALAARFVGLTDLLYVPPWSSQWYVKEAEAHGVDAVVHLVADDTPGGSFITAALEEAGVPVLELRASNADAKAVAAMGVHDRIREFLRTRVVK